MNQTHSNFSRYLHTISDEILVVLLDNLKLFIICVSLFLAIGIYYLFSVTPVYESNMTLEVEQDTSKILNIEDIRKQDLQKLDTLKTIEQNLQSQALFCRVVRKNELSKDPNFLPIPKRRVISEQKLAKRLSKMTTVKLRRGTRLIDLSVKHSSPLMAQKLVEAIASEYIRQDLEQRSGAAESAFSFLIEEARRLRNKLEQSEHAMKVYESSLQRRVDEIKKISAEREAEIATLSIRYKAKHPKLVYAHSQLEQCQLFLSKAALQEPISEDKPYISYNVLAREYEADQIVYEAVLKRMKETQITKGVETSNIRTPAPAFTSEEPVSPKKLPITLYSLLGGLLFASAVIFTRNAVNSSLRTIELTEQILDLPVIATIPNDKDLASSDTPLLPIREDPTRAVSEAFRTMRTTLAVQHRKSKQQIALFTSSIPSEGKSFCAANYAVALAQQGLRTLLIDADMRRPILNKTFRQPEQSDGVSDYLIEKCDFDNIVTPTSIKNLHFISAGPTVADPTQLLSGTRFGDLIKRGIEEFDRLIIDSAPLLSVSDTLLKIEYVDAVYLIVHATKTPRKAVLRAIQLLDRAEVKPVGVILNGSSVNGRNSYQYYSNHVRNKETLWSLQNELIKASS